ncbi:MAG: sugar dehydrogenase complex small subunit [Verrucomicrobiota bacterium]
MDQIASSLWPRRRFIATTSLALSHLLFSSCERRDLPWHEYEPVLPIKYANQPSLDVFMHLSAMVCGVSKLSEGIGKQYFQLMSEEPYGLRNIGMSYHRICSVWKKNPELPLWELIKKFEPLQEGMRWFVGHLAVTWYCGVYYFEDQPGVVITAKEALIWQRLEPLKIHSGFIACPPMYWGDPPEAVS